MSMNIILGSQSPRRQELLTQMGFDYKILVAAIEETIDPSVPAHLVPESIALMKAKALQGHLQKDDLLITADTLVFLGEDILGKPSTEAEATEILQQLSNKMHSVITGVCLQSRNHMTTFSVHTDVFFGELSPTDIALYVARYAPFDKAGSYGIQDWIGYIGVEKIFGSYTNVMGLPTYELYDALKKFNA